MRNAQFFGKQGLTSTSANHIANLCKEAYEKLQLQLDNMSFVRKTLSIIGNVEETTISKASIDTFNNMESIIEEISELKSLIAWLREAIKEKDRLFKENEQYYSDEYIAHMNSTPIHEEYLSEEDIISQWTVKERETYFSLETKCAVLGKLIHPKGTFSKAKEMMFHYSNCPIETEISGRDTIIKKYYLELPENEVENKFFALQKKHREYQAQLNGIKHKIDATRREDILLKDKKHSAEYEEWDNKRKALLLSDKIYRETTHKEIENLKIIIPNNLKEIYDRVTSL